MATVSELPDRSVDCETTEKSQNYARSIRWCRRTREKFREKIVAVSTQCAGRDGPIGTVFLVSAQTRTKHTRNKKKGSKRDTALQPNQTRARMVRV